MRKSQEELQRDRLALEQKNLAIQEIVEHMERVKNKTKEDIAINIGEAVIPILRKLRMKGVSPKYVDLLHSYFNDLVSSFGRRITEGSLRLSPREIEICNMVKGNLSSKEISQLLSVSHDTVIRHRKNIRKKLGISNRKVNLTSFLNNL